MPVNSNKTHLWKEDVARSVDMYNEWFMEFAPLTFRESRKKTTFMVERDMERTQNLTLFNAETLRLHPEILPVLRMSTCPPIAVDRLIGLSGTSSSMIKRIEKSGLLPKKMSKAQLDNELSKIVVVLQKMFDPDIFVWLTRTDPPTESEINRAATIVADRLSGTMSNPIIRNAQEQRQLEKIKLWLEKRGYTHVSSGEHITKNNMLPGTFSFRRNVSVKVGKKGRAVNIPIDVAIQPIKAKLNSMPILFEAKSAGDYTNPNKRRKEEATKIQQLRASHGSKTRFNLFLCGYFDSGYLGYEASEGIDWVWEHRIDDFEKFGI